MDGRAELKEIKAKLVKVREAWDTDAGWPIVSNAIENALIAAGLRHVYSPAGPKGDGEDERTVGTPAENEISTRAPEHGHDHRTDAVGGIPGAAREGVQGVSGEDSEGTRRDESVASPTSEDVMIEVDLIITGLEANAFGIDGPPWDSFCGRLRTLVQGLVEQRRASGELHAQKTEQICTLIECIAELEAEIAERERRAKVAGQIEAYEDVISKCGNSGHWKFPVWYSLKQIARLKEGEDA